MKDSPDGGREVWDVKKLLEVGLLPPVQPETIDFSQLEKMFLIFHLIFTAAHRSDQLIIHALTYVYICIFFSRHLAI